MSRAFGRRLAVVVLAAGLLVAADRAAAQVDLPTAELEPHFQGGKEGHAYTHAMLELGMRMGAATTAALREDPPRAVAALKGFREQYAKVSGMVPSWRGQFRGSIIDELEAAVTGKADLPTRRKIVSRIEKSCTACHARFMFPVQAAYRWGNFSTATISTDQGASLTLHQVMLDLSNNLGAVRGDIEAGQLAPATLSFKLLMERFGMMEQLCANCHDQPRQYFIDSSVKSRLFKVGGLLRRGETRPAEYAPLFKDVNEMSCLPCHQVHMPAAFQQEYLRESKR
jgi:hypothetical protein